MKSREVESETRRIINYAQNMVKVSCTPVGPERVKTDLNAEIKTMTDLHHTRQVT